MLKKSLQKSFYPFLDLWEGVCLFGPGKTMWTYIVPNMYLQDEVWRSSLSLEIENCQWLFRLDFWLFNFRSDPPADVTWLKGKKEVGEGTVYRQMVIIMRKKYLMVIRRITIIMMIINTGRNNDWSVPPLNFIGAPRTRRHHQLHMHSRVGPF